MDWDSYEIIDITENLTEIEEFKLKHNIITNGGVDLYPTGYYLNITQEDKFIINEYQQDLGQFLIKNKELRSYIS